MKAEDVMTTDVIGCSPGDTVANVAALMAERGISGLPVVDGGELVGMVSEGDLIARSEIGSGEKKSSWWLRLLGTQSSASDYVKASGQHVRDVMTTEVVSVNTDTPLSDVANLFASEHIKRAPVLDGGKLVGIVSRANLVQAVAAASRAMPTSAGANDASIRESLTAELSKHDWWRGGVSSLTVVEGVVHYWGYYNEPEEVDAARVAAENTAGVSAVEDHRAPYPIAYVGS